MVKAVRERFQRDHEVIDIDGARINFGQGWGLVRASNTQPVLVLRFEAHKVSGRSSLGIDTGQVNDLAAAGKSR